MKVWIGWIVLLSLVVASPVPDKKAEDAAIIDTKQTETHEPPTLASSVVAPTSDSVDQGDEGSADMAKFPAEATAITAGAFSVFPPADSASKDKQSSETTEHIRGLLESADKCRRKAVEPEDMAACVELYQDIIKIGNQIGSRSALNELAEIYLYAEAGLDADFSKALDLFNQSAGMGSCDAQHNMALMYSLGLGVEQSDAVALLYDYFSAMDGSNGAKMSLGYRHLYGLGVPQSCESSVLYYSQVAEEVVKELSARPVATVIERARLQEERSRTQSLEEDEDVIQYYQQSAENGDIGAQVALGHLHFYGARGVEQNAERAARYFRAAANQGEPNAMSNLGQMHVQGIGVPKDNETAFKYFTEAAAMNNAAAQNGLGFMYLHGYGTKQDQKMALKYFKQAADQGNAEAQFHLGAMYFGGIGVEKKYSTALQYYNLAGHQGHTRAMYNLGQMHLNGLGTIRSCSTGIKLIKTVAERGSWATVLGAAHRNFLKGNMETAVMQYSAAAEEGYEVAQSNSAYMFDHNLGYDHPNRAKLAMRHYLAASDQGNVDALRMMGDYAFYGIHGTADPAKAAKYYTQASNNRNAHAMFNLGWMHEHGIGLPKDFHLAKRFYDQAAETELEAYVPVRIALTGLWLHRKYEEWTAWWEGRQVSASTNMAPTPVATPGVQPQSSQQQAASAAAGSRQSDKPSSKHSKPWWLEEWPLEDILLLVLCGAFAFCVYVLSQRRL